MVSLQLKILYLLQLMIRVVHSDERNMKYLTATKSINDRQHAIVIQSGTKYSHICAHTSMQYNCFVR